MNDIIQTIAQFISPSSLGVLAMIVIATIGATQIAKLFARMTTGAKYDGILVQITALTMALIFSYIAWKDPTGWLVGGFVAYTLSSVIAKFGINYLKEKYPSAAKFINQPQGDISNYTK